MNPASETKTRGIRDLPFCKPPPKTCFFGLFSQNRLAERDLVLPVATGTRRGTVSIARRFWIGKTTVCMRVYNSLDFSLFYYFSFNIMVMEEHANKKTHNLLNKI